MACRNWQLRGFTLVEIAMVLAVIGLVAGGALMGYRGFVGQAHYSQTQTYLESAHTALLNYAQTRGYLPCPASDNSGREDRSGPGICASHIGLLPWLDLNLDSRTPQGDIAFYIVNADVDTACPNAADQSQCFFDMDNAPAFNLQTPPRPGSNGAGNLTVNNPSGDPLAQNVIAIVGSFGSNEGIACNRLSADERENCNDDNEIFVLDGMRQNPADFFDDQLVWIHANTLKGRMRDAGLL